MIVGIVAENPVFVMHTIKMRQALGESLDYAIIKANLIRTRPILMTISAAVLTLGMVTEHKCAALSDWVI